MDCYNDGIFWFNAEKEDYRRLKIGVEDATDIMGVVNLLIDPKQQLNHASTNNMVCMLF